MAWTPLGGGGGYDGDFTVARAVGETRRSRPIPLLDNAFVIKIEHVQFRANYVRLPLNTTGSYESQVVYLVEETELRDMGGGLVSWDRVYANLPTPYVENVIVSKHYMAGEYIYNAQQILDQWVVSWSQLVRASANHTFYLGTGNVPYLGAIPFIQTVKFFSSQIITDAGTGFPRAALPGGPPGQFFSNNFGASVLGASIEPYMGLMVRETIIYGAA